MNRRHRKAKKLKAKGTYRRDDQWKLDRSKLRLEISAKFLSECLGVSVEELCATFARNLAALPSTYQHTNISRLP